MMNERMTMAGGGNRLEWLDAMRGFTMLMVVAYHVAQISFGEQVRTSSALPFFVLFRMPLFFFVSGFVAYKADFVWSASNTGKLAWKKLKIQVLPAFIFLCIFIILRKPHFCEWFTDAMKSPTKGGYWFTWVLLHMFLIYYAFSFVLRSLNGRQRNYCFIALWIVSIGVYELCFLPKLWHPEQDAFLKSTSLLQTMQYFQFFLFGNLVRRNWQRVQTIFDSRWFFPTICILCFICCADVFRWHNLQFAWTNLPRTTAIYSLVLIVVMFFRFYKDWFTKQTMVGRGLQYVGTRTLDVYILHYIFLPRLPEVGKWLNAHQPNFVIDTCIGMAFAIVVVAFCLLVSNLLRISPLFSENLFGRKVKK